MIVGNPIIMILKAILNWFRLRRDYIANAVDKIPPEIKDALVAWYSPYCKQRMTNHDVIEAYVEDFTKWVYRDSRGVAKITNNTIVITNVVETNNIVEDANEPYSDLTIRVTGVTENKYLIVRQGRGKPESYIKKDGVYTFKDNNLYFGFGVNVIGECNITITQLPTSILKDFSGNKHDAYLYGFKGKLNSGIGTYKIDFTAYTKTNIVSDVSYNAVKIIPTQINYSFVIYGNKEIPSYTVNVQNPTNSIITYRYATENRREEMILTNGINKLPKSINSNQTYQIGFKINSIDDTNSEEITITQIPDYPNQLCYDGKSYAVAYGLPILTDYTVIADRTWFDKNNQGVFMSKAVPGNDSAFIFEHIQNAIQSVWNYGLQNVIPIKDNGVVYCNKTSYNGDKINIGQAIDSDTLHIGKTRETSNIYFNGCHGDILLFNRTLTDDELDLVKKHFFGIVRIKDALLTVDSKPIITTDNKYIKLNKK